MPDHTRQQPRRLWWLIIALIIFAGVLDGGLSRTEALDRWVGTAVVSASGQTAAFDFIVLVDPGRSASFEWRFRNVQVFSGPLAATVFGSTVTGTLFPVGGLATRLDSTCCRPCNFSGTIVGNRVDGTFDPVSCTDDGSGGTFFLIKQQ